NSIAAHQSPAMIIGGRSTEVPASWPMPDAIPRAIATMRIPGPLKMMIIDHRLPICRVSLAGRRATPVGATPRNGKNCTLSPDAVSKPVSGPGFSLRGHEQAWRKTLDPGHVSDQAKIAGNRRVFEGVTVKGFLATPVSALNVRFFPFRGVTPC